MRGIRIWHLAALVLSVPLLAAAVPPGCTGGFNPTFVGAIGGDPASALPVPEGYHVLGIFNRTAWDGNVVVPIVGSGSSWTTTWSIGFNGLTVRGLAWKCDLQQMSFTGGTLSVPDGTGAVQDTPIEFTGPPLDLGNQLECGLLVKASIVPVVPGTAATLGYVIIDDPFATPQTYANLTYHIIVDLLADETDDVDTGNAP